MSKLNYQGQVVVQKKDYNVGEVVDSLINLPSSEVKGFFQKIGLTVPKTLRVKVLKETLKDFVDQTVLERANLADELGYRLSWFDHFSEFQLEKLLQFANSTSLERKYRLDLWLYLLNYIIDKKVDEKEIELLFKKAKEFSVIEEDILSFNLGLKEIFFDQPKQIDGLTQEDFRVVLYKSSTLNEIRELGFKYDVNVPRRLKKDQLADIICFELTERKELTPLLEEKIRGMSIVLMQRFAKDKDIKASIELKKEEIIEYILANANQTKESYFLPSDRSAYEKEIVPTPKPVIEKPAQVVVEPVIIEEKKTEVVIPIKPVEEKVVTVHKHTPEYEEVLKELALLREELMDHLSKCKCSKKKS